MPGRQGGGCRSTPTCSTATSSPAPPATSRRCRPRRRRRDLRQGRHGTADYWEIHVTPNDFLLDIHIPDRARISKGGTITWEQVEPFVPPASGAARRVAVTDSAWSVEVTVPWSAFAGTLRLPRFGLAVRRLPLQLQRRTRGSRASSTARITELNFHRHEEYTDLVF